MTATADTVITIPPLVARLCDDAAIFPPGNLPLEEAVPAHLRHLESAHAGLVGPFVIGAAALDRLVPLVADLPQASFEVSLTVPSPDGVADALATADGVPALLVRTVEVAVPEGVPAADVIPLLDVAVAGREDVEVYVELPRDDRRPALVERLTGTRYLAKLRTGGVRADLHPDEAELAAAVVTLTRAGVPFKATAGLHHAVRHTAPGTGFEQHGFLNVLAAVDAALSGADAAEVAAVLALRDGQQVADRVRAPRNGVASVRQQFRSFGTCSIDDPLDDLTALRVVATPLDGTPTDGRPSDDTAGGRAR